MSGGSDGPRLRVGLLAYGFDLPLSGVTRVAAELGQALQASGECDLVWLTTLRARSGGTSWWLRGCATLPGLLLLGGAQIALAARRLRLDLVHDPIGVSPFTVGRRLGPFRRVLTIHDAIALRWPGAYPWLNRFLHRHHVPATLHNVDAVVTVSRHAAAELRRALRLSPERLHVVPNGVGERFRPAGDERVDQVIRRYGLTTPFVLSVGARQARKNLPRLLQSFALVRAEQPALRLAIVGPTLWPYPDLRRQVAALRSKHAVSLLGYVPDTDLPALYSAASVFVFPSLYEGFGLPVLEAMACGTPVVCSNTTALPEVAGDAAVLVDPGDVSAIAAGIRAALTDPEQRNTLRQRGLARAAELSWARTARETTRVYRHVLDGAR